MGDRIDYFSGDYRFLSNFWPSEVNFNGVTYTTVEHGYQAAKTLSDSERLWIKASPTPGVAKRRGKEVTLREDWEQVKLYVMETLLRLKFSDPELCFKLLLTGNAELIEGNTWGDTYWGVCRGRGSNNLGKLLMKIREVLR